MGCAGSREKNVQQDKPIELENITEDTGSKIGYPEEATVNGSGDTGEEPVASNSEAIVAPAVIDQDADYEYNESMVDVTNTIIEEMSVDDNFQYNESTVEDAAMVNDQGTETIKEPHIMQGFMKKEGHQVKNWKSRYFVLGKGLLKYYLLPLESYPYGQQLKGEISLENYRLETPESIGHHKHTIALIATVSTKPNLNLSCDDELSRDAWTAALRSHIQYAQRPSVM